IPFPSLEIPKNAHFFTYTLQNPCTFFLFISLKLLIYLRFAFFQQTLIIKKKILSMTGCHIWC
ncbi:MAG: hypothetical protein ACKPBV_03590, partial [Sphaerospermopsis kisseleviana]